MRILLIVDSYSKHASGGLVAHRTAEILRKAGYIVGVYCAGPADSKQGDETDVNWYQKYSVSNNLKHIWPGEEVTEFRKVVDDFKPDVVHFCSFLYAKSRFFISHALAVGARVVLQPWIYDFLCEQMYDYRRGQPCGLCVSGNFLHSVFNRCGAPRSLFIHVLSRYLLRGNALRCHSVLSTNKTMDESLERYGFSKEKIIRASLSFDPKHIEKLPVCDGKDFIFYGQLRDFKGAHLLQSIVTSCPTAMFSLYPVVSSEGQILKYGLDQSKLHNVRVDIGLNWFSGLAERVAACRGVLLPSLWPTTTEYVLMEAMGLSKAIVAFDVGAHREILVNRKNAMVVPIGNVQAFAEAILELDKDADLRRKIGYGARQTFETLTNSKELLSKLTKAYVGA